MSQLYQLLNQSSKMPIAGFFAQERLESSDSQQIHRRLFEELDTQSFVQIASSACTFDPGPDPDTDPDPQV